MIAGIVALLALAIAVIVVMAHWDAVPHEAYDERGRRVRDLEQLRDRLLGTVDDLRTELARMRRDGFSAARPAKVNEPADEETQALDRAENVMIDQLRRRGEDEAFIKRAMTKLMQDNPGLSPSDARAEAIRLRHSVTDEDPPT